MRRRMKVKAVRSYHRHLVADMWREFGRPLDMSSGGLVVDSIPSNTEFSIQINPRLSMALVKVNGHPVKEHRPEEVVGL